ncbi:methylated-DNA--[protein]-cysteine S-methyltransferase [Spiractinospora alimapuensis]|nr:methylated-DNA--[protein]-cysteine S-methyltransferase [Spiractinospora alimapuensis]
MEATHGTASSPPAQVSRPVTPERSYPVVVGVAETPVGFLSVAVTNRGVAACTFDPEEVLTARLARTVSARIGTCDRRLDPVRRQLNRYFDGQSVSFSLTLDLRLVSDFGRAVLRATRDIPYGGVTTHESIAERIGRPEALRAVRNSLLTNPLCVLLPCHRAVSVDYPHDVGEYAGGHAAKRYLLSLEERADPPVTLEPTTV